MVGRESTYACACDENKAIDLELMADIWGKESEWGCRVQERSGPRDGSVGGH